MKINTYVELKTFLGTDKAYEEVKESENFWKLIGEKGRVISEEKNQALVLFSKNIDNYNLVNHNPQKNSIWINKSDLKLDRAKLYEKKLKNKTFKKNSLMNNSKWKYLLEIIDSLNVGITAQIKFIGDDNIRKSNISGYSNSIISREGIEMFGYLKFKEIEWLKIPEKIKIERKNREELLEPKIEKQPIKEIVQKLERGKKISYELEKEELIIFGYK